MTIGNLIRHFHQELDSSYDIDEVRNFTFLVIEHFFSWKKSQILIKKHEFVSPEILNACNSIIKRLKKMEPIQYILGEAYFYDLMFNVNQNVLIPRPETEELVDLIIKDIERKNIESPTILDVGTGSGCIAIALKKNIDSAKVFGIDVSNKALEVANNNAHRNKTDVSFFEQDIFTTLSHEFSDKLRSSSLDVIVSNPPYIALSEKELMRENVLNYEPHLALFVPNDNPMLYYNSIANQAILLLKKGGVLYFEINEQFGQKVVNLLVEKNFSDIHLKKDLNGKDRFVFGYK